MKPAVSIKNLGKQYKLGLVHQDMLVNKWINSFTRSFRGKSNNQPVLTGPSEIWALKEVSYDVMPGEVVGIIGRNGAGKSTLLKILSRITAPTEGEIRLQGRVASLLEVGTGFHSELTGRENIYLNGSILGMTKKEIDRKFDEILDFAETEDFIDTPVKRYSSGMYVRLAFAVAAHLEPEILVVDEVLAVGDASFQNKCLGKMQTVASEGRTVLFVSHQMGTLGKLCKTAFQLEQGRVVNSGSSDIVIAQYLQAMNENNLAEAVFEADDNKSISLQKIRILNHEGDSTTVLDRAKPFRMEITYRVNEDAPQAYLTFTLTTDDRVVRLCNSKDVDSTEGIYPRSKGIYTSTVEFPGGILNVGNYSADIGLFKSRKMLSDQAKSPTFELVDIGDIGNYQTSQMASKRGILALHLSWQIEKVE